MRAIVCAALVVILPPAARAAESKPNFSRDVRPILSDNCFQCHGPDEKARKADLRLDTQDGLVAAKKHVLERVLSKDADEVMPPPKSGKKLTAEQLASLKAWVEQGGEWSSHWAFAAPVRPTVPTTKHPVANPIDAFIRAKLEAAGVPPAAPAEKARLLRRVTFDLTGVPPTPAEVGAFLKDDSPNAFEKVVDRLLASPRYGERMAWRWLEAARYADTNGYQTDAGRDMWRWRDWVIEAYNRNLPFDRFTIEQLAGDLLPNPTLDQRIATGFNRNHRGNSEGGIVPEEYAVEYVADRVETTATVWLGLTFTCCRCHDHKFDPFTQKEFYRLFAYFNNVPESGRAWKYGNSPPFIKAPTKEQQSRIAALNTSIDVIEQRLKGVQGKLARGVDAWKPDETVAIGGFDVAEHYSLDGSEPGRVGKSTSFDGKRIVTYEKGGDFGFDDRFTLSCWIYATAANGTILSRTTAEAQGEGYSVSLVNSKLQVYLTKRWLDDALRIESETSIKLNEWTHVAVSYDAGRVASGTKIYLDGSLVKARVLMDELNQTFQTKEPFRIGGGGGAGFQGRIDDVKLFKRDLEPAEIGQHSVAESIAEIARKPASERTAHQASKLLAAYVELKADDKTRDSHRTLRKLHEARRQLMASVPTVMVMEEMPTPRPAHVLLRGDYEKKGEKVTPGTPAALAPVAHAAGSKMTTNRLDLAKWLVDPANPLTARVAVNRAWQLHFGTGLVKTTEDFGTQAAFPTHPELLDWLAVEFRNDWDIKKLHKLIVMSHTYQQSSNIPKSPKDPENKLLSRFPRQRLSPEMVRDQALFAGGLLVEKLGGPSVKPYQPPGLWKELSGAADYVQDTGEGLYRRSLYSYWKRTSPPPVLATFDAAGREVCWVRETRTNTPLQALTLLNETGFVEASRKLAERAMKADDRIVAAFRLVLGRTPTDAEATILKKSYDARLADFKKHADAAKRLLAVGDSKTDPKRNPAELAALTVVCGTILNLDEAITKE